MRKILTSLAIIIFVAMACAAMCDEIVFDKEILKKTPTIDGKIMPGEWEVFYTYNTENDIVTSYVNWDFDNLYFGCTLNAIESISIVLDLNADGWTVGDDNYLILTNENGELDVLKVVKTGEEGVTLVNIDVPETNQIHGEQSLVNGKTNLEIAIPARMVGKNNFDMGKTNFNFAIKTPEADWNTFNPKDITDNTIGCNLVNHKSFALAPLTLDFYLTREKAVASETIDGKVKIKNHGSEPIVIKELIMAGEGLSEDIVSSYKIKVGEIRPGKTFEREYHTKVLPDTPLGAKALGCEIYTDQMKVGGVLRSFEIINPSKSMPYLPKEVYYTNDKVIRIGVRILSYTDKRATTGYASVVVPEGWEIEGNNHNKFKVIGYNKYVDLIFRLTPPLGAIGHFKIPITVNKGTEQETVTCDFDIVQTR
ncbi:MAG: hypothetical protein IJS60_05020 [Abditibacteriota bacterium]|nr:hypothetical protein [Abditibacteriota bacterium]